MLALTLASLLAFASPDAADDLQGAWQQVREDGTTGTWIVSGNHFSIAWYRRSPNRFISTEGGTWTKDGDALRLTYEFDTANPERVGTTETARLDDRWKRLDSGTPGALHGAWLMTGRVRDGKASTRTPGARRTMKILSGTRFQWIAYNVETKQFFGTGGGTYSTADGKYTENIEFFSRDDAKAGRSLEFRYELVDGVWNHIGKSTAGEAMHEIWERRGKLGI